MTGKRFLLLALLAAAAYALLAWPRISVVETGRTPEYPELQERAYEASEEKVVAAVKAALDRLPGFRLVGAGRGPGGSSIQAEHESVIGLVEELTIRVRRDGRRTRVSVRSRSRSGPLDLGQNARNIRALFEALDREVS
jgi:uncharacterized protein (DUF1499 family)